MFDAIEYFYAPLDFRTPRMNRLPSLGNPNRVYDRMPTTADKVQVLF
jgi:hypothetical protein